MPGGGDGSGGREPLGRAKVEEASAKQALRGPGDRGVTVQFARDPNLPAVIADQVVRSRSCWNSLRNAVEAMEDRSRARADASAMMRWDSMVAVGRRRYRQRHSPGQSRCSCSSPSSPPRAPAWAIGLAGLPRHHRGAQWPAVGGAQSRRRQCVPLHLASGAGGRDRGVRRATGYCGRPRISHQLSLRGAERRSIHLPDEATAARQAGRLLRRSAPRNDRKISRHLRSGRKAPEPRPGVRAAFAGADFAAGVAHAPRSGHLSSNREKSLRPTFFFGVMLRFPLHVICDVDFASLQCSGPAYSRGATQMPVMQATIRRSSSSPRKRGPEQNGSPPTPG